MGVLGKGLRRIRKEIVDVLPAVLFFFLALNLIDLADSLMFRSQRIVVFREARLLFGCLVVAKLLPMLNLLPFLLIFRGKPLIYSIVWKSLIYSTGLLIFRIADTLIPVVHRYQSVAIAWRHVDWFQFWGIQIWIVSLLTIYAAAYEVVDAIGAARLWELLFGPKRGSISGVSDRSFDRVR